MLEQLKIENFRCFKSFELNHLGKVNLLVGENNCGKTSILEAIQLFFSNADLQTISSIMSNRGEYSIDSENLDISNVFSGYQIETERYFEIIGKNSNKAEEKLKLSIKKRSKEVDDVVKEAIKIFQTNEKIGEALMIKAATIIEKDHIDKGVNLSKHKVTYPLTHHGKLYSKVPYDKYIPLGLVVEADNEVLKTNFVNSSSLTPQESLELFNQVVLTTEEDLVYQALQIIEPNIERIAPIGNEIKNNNSRGGFFVRLSDTQKRIPIGSMGDGIWRMLGLSLALVSAKDGVLLVDEIDTGLHYTALEDMWKLIWETAKKLNVQVFATTHNSDCWKALEALTSREDVGEEDISIQRIEKDAPRSVAYNKDEIATAVERETEVR